MVIQIPDNQTIQHPCNAILVLVQAAVMIFAQFLEKGF
jgi:hypothetical protein